MTASNFPAQRKSTGPVPLETSQSAQKKQLEEILNKLSTEDRQKLEQLLSSPMAVSSFHYQGPIPPASELAGIDRIIPGGADRIIRMAENQAQHRQDIEKVVITCQQNQSGQGQWFAFIIALALVGTGTFCILKSHDWAGAVIITSTLVSAAGTFIVGKSSQKQNLAEKNKQIIPSANAPKK